jgi:hypothetical protein
MVGVAQLVEHLVVVQDVAGSSPVTHPRGVSVGNRAAVLRRSEQTRFSSARDDEVGGFHARCANAPNRGIGQNRGTIVAEVR